jgi:hypothetical protein
MARNKPQGFYPSIDEDFDRGVADFIAGVKTLGSVGVEDLERFRHPYVPMMRRSIEANERVAVNLRIYHGWIRKEPEPPEWEQMGLTWREWLYNEKA